MVERREMKLVFGLNRIKKFRKAVVALGVFDGVHRGHRRVLRAAVVKARSIKGTSVALTFWPHPQRQDSLYSLQHRLRLIRDLGIFVSVVINFDKRFSRMPAVSFIEKVLIGRLGARYVYVGRNFRFGKGALGSVNTLKYFAGRGKFGLRIFEVMKFKNRPISSTYIRSLIKGGDLITAENLLGRPVSILGTVIRGKSLGKRLGFPTANIKAHHEVIPPAGIYAVKVIFMDKVLKGACYIGIRPSIKIKNRKIHIEVHLFNFKNKIYGRYLEIQFVKKIREDKKFATLKSLAAQMKIDVKNAKKILSRH